MQGENLNLSSLPALARWFVLSFIYLARISKEGERLRQQAINDAPNCLALRPRAQLDFGQAHYTNNEHNKFRGSRQCPSFRDAAMPSISYINTLFDCPFWQS